MLRHVCRMAICADIIATTFAIAGLLGVCANKKKGHAEARAGCVENFMQLLLDINARRAASGILQASFLSGKAHETTCSMHWACKSVAVSMQTSLTQHDGDSRSARCAT